jgi:hypothetical protein
VILRLAISWNWLLTYQKPKEGKICLTYEFVSKIKFSLVKASKAFFFSSCVNPFEIEDFPGNLYNDLPVILKGRKKESRTDQNKDSLKTRT